MAPPSSAPAAESSTLSTRVFPISYRFFSPEFAIREKWLLSVGNPTRALSISQFPLIFFFSHRHLIILACYLDLHLYSCPRWLSTRVVFSVLRPRDLQSPHAFLFPLFELPQGLQSLRASLLSVFRGLHSFSVCFIGFCRISYLSPKANRYGGPYLVHPSSHSTLYCGSLLVCANPCMVVAGGICLLDALSPQL